MQVLEVGLGILPPASSTFMAGPQPVAPFPDTQCIGFKSGQASNRANAIEWTVFKSVLMHGHALYVDLPYLYAELPRLDDSTRF